MGVPLKTHAAYVSLPLMKEDTMLTKLSKTARAKELVRLRRAVKDKDIRITDLRKNKRRINRRTRMIPPKPYRSWFEVDIAIDALKSGIIFEYEKEHIIWIEPEKVRKYNPDYFVETKSGNLIIVEAKGRWTPEDRKKICYVTEQNPRLDVRMLFERDNTLSKSPKSKKYSEWCDRKGIKYAVGRAIPEEWINE